MRTLSTRTRTLADDAELARLEKELTRRWADLQPPIAMEWSETSMVALDRGTPWLFGPAECDPLRDHRGRLPMPRRQRARLKELAERGLPFHRVALAHELDPEGPARELLSDRRQAPRAVTMSTARQLVGAPAHPAVIRAAHLLDVLVDGAGGAAAGLVDAALDPIVFGVAAPRAPRPGDVTLWFPLVAWRW